MLKLPIQTWVIKVKQALASLEELALMPKFLVDYLRDQGVDKKVRFLTLSLALPILTLLLIVLALFIYRLYDSLESKLRSTRDAIYNNLQEYGRLAREYASLLATTPLVQRELLSKIPNAGPLIHIGLGLIRNFGINEVTFIEATGIVIARSHEPNNFGDSLHHHREVALALEGKSTVFFSTENHPAKLISCVPVSYDQEILGAICVAYLLDLTFAKRLYQLTGGFVFFATGEATLFSSLGKLKKGQLSLSKDSFSKKALLLHRDGKETTYYLEFLATKLPYERSSEKPLFIYCALDMSRERAWLNLMVFFMLISATAIVGTALLISLKVANNLTRAIAKISMGISRIASGQLDTRLPVESQDELGQLAKSVNTMAQELKQSYEQLEEAKKKIEAHAEILEQKVEERTRELKASLEEIRALKEKQDADYYLTSALAIPLSGIKGESEVFQIEYRTEQKKKFQYRRFQREIGGDLTAARSIELRGKPYIALINADAMGKSIQGAGGALVLGAAFEALCHRSAHGLRDERSPERWIKESLIELHKLFLGFDGAMMASCCLILAEEENGAIYWSNAEHPFPVLYRDGKATYLEKETYLRKLGMVGVPFEPRINVLQLRPKDVVLFGTDGREDILLWSGKLDREINEDPLLFLRITEKAEGQLQRIFEILPNFGEIIDDISLLALSLKETNSFYQQTDLKLYHEMKKLIDGKAYLDYCEKFKENRENWQKQPELWRLYVKALALDKRLEEAAQEAYAYVLAFPTDNRMLYEATRLLARTGQEALAAYLREKLLCREPYNPEYRKLELLLSSHG
ncbi:MAG: SpoIIE family protein phosphatase [Leptospiraceae bacterium]|nr:SpoIIE family protein phosphatase [Leptospiraceae bacterium]